MAKGTIKTLTDRDFGFIDAGGKDVFFHMSALEGVSYDKLQEGQAVEYEIKDSPKGPQATKVRVVVQEVRVVAENVEGVIKTLRKDQGVIRPKNGIGAVVVFERSEIEGTDFEALELGWQVEYDEIADEIMGGKTRSRAVKVRLVSKEIHDPGKIRYQFARQRKKAGQPISTIRAGCVDHRIDKLNHSDKWVLFIDESGKDFIFDQYADAKLTGDKRGRFVGILMPWEGEPSPLGVPIEERVNYHFTDMPDLDQMDQVLQDLLDAPVGIFGVTVHELPPTRGERWVSGVAHVINWVLRLLPLDDPTTVSVRVENRFEHNKQSDWTAMKDVLLLNLTETNPQRYRKLDVNISIVDKSYPCSCYADAVAHTFGGTAADAAARLKQSGLKGTCLHAGDGKNLMQAWDLLKTGTHLDGESWQELVHDPDSGESRGIAQILLDQVSQSCQQDTKLWNRYFEATQQHLGSKAIDLKQLGKEVHWLKACQPDDATIPEKLELAWLTAQLEARNHNGCIDEDTVSKLETLGESLYEEAPSLV